jgi:hypothetical protein
MTFDFIEQYRRQDLRLHRRQTSDGLRELRHAHTRHGRHRLHREALVKRRDENHQWSPSTTGGAQDRRAAGLGRRGRHRLNHRPGRRPSVHAGRGGGSALAAAFRELNVRATTGTSTSGHAGLPRKRAAKCYKFVYCSTCGVHGDVKNPPTDEEHNIAPADYCRPSTRPGPSSWSSSAGLPTVIAARPRSTAPATRSASSRSSSGWRRAL